MVLEAKELRRTDSRLFADSHLNLILENIMTIYVCIFWQENKNAIGGIEVNTEFFTDLEKAEEFLKSRKLYAYNARIEVINLGEIK
jgi:hypothetical protein